MLFVKWIVSIIACHEFENQTSAASVNDNDNGNHISDNDTGNGRSVKEGQLGIWRRDLRFGILGSAIASWVLTWNACVKKPFTVAHVKGLAWTNSTCGKMKLLWKKRQFWKCMTSIHHLHSAPGHVPCHWPQWHCPECPTANYDMIRNNMLGCGISKLQSSSEIAKPRFEILLHCEKVYSESPTTE